MTKKRQVFIFLRYEFLTEPITALRQGSKLSIRIDISLIKPDVPVVLT